MESMERREREIFPPLKHYLEERGYEVEGEVRGCDLVARRGEEVVVVELKTRFSLALLAQAVERQEYADSVYVAVPISSATAYPPSYKRVRKLLRRLGLGALLVRFLSRSVRVELLFHPGEYEPPRRLKERRALIREVDGRVVTDGVGGTARRRGETQLTAYRQAALHLAILLREQGPASPADLRRLGGAERAAAILRDNHYGWFNRVRRGVYELDPAGAEALEKLSSRIEGLESSVLMSIREREVP